MNDLTAALQALRAGGLVVLPTDTVYGVAALPSDSRAVAAIFEAKGRPIDKPLPLLGADLPSLRSVAQFDASAERLATAFWPGALTLVLPRAVGFTYDLGGSDRDSIAVRVPASPVARSLIQESGPLAVTSANRSGEPPANSIEAAKAALGEAVAVYLDGGPGGGTHSTVVSLIDGPDVIREGALPTVEILAMLA